MKGRGLRIAAAVLTVLVAIGGVLVYRVLRVEEIPETLETPLDPALLEIPGVGEQPPLSLAAQRGHPVFLVFVGIQSFQSDEGKKINRALNRWTYPEGTRGFIVFDVEGLGFLKDKSTEYMQRFGAEARFEMYGDFEGAFRNVFKLPQGHHGFVLVDAEGKLQLRHSGGFSTDAEIESLRQTLGATEPEPGPAVPAFEGGGLSTEGCAHKPCIVLLLGEAVALGDVPWVDGGFEGDQQARWEQAAKPEIRAVSVALGLPLDDKADGLVVGKTIGIELLPGWSQVEEADAIREAFAVDPGTTALLVLRDGQVAFRREGIARFYELGRVSDLLGVEYKRDD